MKDVILLFLLISALVDVRTKRLPVFWLYAGFVCMGVYMLEQFMAGGKEGGELLFALLPGAICFLWAKMTKTMGEADAWLILGMGLCFSPVCVLGILLTAFFLAALAGIVLLCMKRNFRNRRMAFVPFLFCSVLIMRIGGAL